MAHMMAKPMQTLELQYLMIQFLIITKYKFHRNKITQLLKVSKKNYYHNYFIANSNNIKKTWAGIKELITLKPNGFNSPSKFVVDNNVITDSTAIATAFNNHFSQIGSKLAEEILQVDIDPLDFLGPSEANSFMQFPASVAEIEEIITLLNLSKVSGPFSIPVCLLKLLKTCISFPLEFIFNISFSSGCVSDQFKLANVIPVHAKRTWSLVCMTTDPFHCSPVSIKSWRSLYITDLTLLLINIIFCMTNNLVSGEIISLLVQLFLPISRGISLDFSEAFVLLIIAYY